MSTPERIEGPRFHVRTWQEATPGCAAPLMWYARIVPTRTLRPDATPVADDVLDALARRAELHEVLTEPGGGTAPIAPADLAALVAQVRALRADPQAGPRAVSTCPDTPRLTMAGAVEAAIEKYERIWGANPSASPKK